jgi:peptidoglycan/xylan/chitin deacetylase (PgdA/CDA1 family)
VKIYTLHTVAENGMSLSPRLFRKFIRYVQRKSAFVPPALLGEPLGAGGCLLTFDDCYADNFSNALPILDECGLKALFFFTPGFLGKVRWGSRSRGVWRDDRDADFNLPFGFMGLSELHALRALGHEIGFHSRTHRNLTECTDVELRDEIVTAKVEWEGRLGFQFRTFAFPRGRHDSRMSPLLVEAGYQFSFTTQPGAADPEVFVRLPHALPRFPIQRRGLFGWL